MKKLLLAATFALLGCNANAAEVRDIIEFGSAIPACTNIDDTHEIRLIEARAQDEFGRKTIYGRVLVQQYIAEKRIKTDDNNSMPACHWIYGGEARYVAEKRLGKNASQPVAYFCMGSLMQDTNMIDKSKPCHWVFMGDK
jgi:hypothetical protein